MQAANSLQKREPAVLTRAQSTIIEHLMDGMPYTEVAKRISRGDQRVAKQWRHKIRYWMRNDPVFREALGVASAAEMGLSVPQVTHAMIRRASRGRTDAAKLVFEASGFHNPRVQHDHEHSGEIHVTVQSVRPAPVADADATAVVDADVVE